MGNARINRVPFYLTKNLQFFIVFEGKIFILINYRRYKKKLYNHITRKRRKKGTKKGTKKVAKRRRRWYNVKRRKGRFSAEEKIYFLSIEYTFP